MGFSASAVYCLSFIIQYLRLERFLPSKIRLIILSSNLCKVNYGQRCYLHGGDLAHLHACSAMTLVVAPVSSCGEGI